MITDDLTVLQAFVISLVSNDLDFYPYDRPVD